MQRLLIITISLLYSCYALGKSNYQIDLIIFAQPAIQGSESQADLPLIPMSSNAIELKNGAEKTAALYSLLPNSSSNLKDQYYLLSHRSSYPVLGHFSWRQPGNNQSSVALPLIENKGWQMQGVFRIVESSYYSFDAKLQVSSPRNPLSAFSVIQKQRLKDNVVYYLDHDRIGMVIKIHKLA